jgi:hypothetical protein
MHRSNGSLAIRRFANFVAKRWGRQETVLLVRSYSEIAVAVHSLRAETSRAGTSLVEVIVSRWSFRVKENPGSGREGCTGVESRTSEQAREGFSTQVLYPLGCVTYGCGFH